MGDHGDGSTGNGRGRVESIGAQSRNEASAYNDGRDGDRYRVVVVIGGTRYVCENTYDRLTPALDRVVEIERTTGFNAFVLRETSEAMR